MAANVGFRILVDTNQMELAEAVRSVALAAEGVWAITHNSPDIPKSNWPATLARLNANLWAVSEDDPNQSYEVNAVQEYIGRPVDGAMCYFEGRPDDNTVLTNDEINTFAQTHGNKIVVLSRSYGSADLRRKAVDDALQNSNCSGVVFETNPESEGGVMWNQDFNDGIKHCLGLGKHCYLLLPPKNDGTTDYVEDIKSAMRYFVHSGELYNTNLFVVLAVYSRELSKVGYFEPEGNNIYEALTWLKNYRDNLILKKLRQSPPTFDVVFYLGYYPDLQAEFGADNYDAATYHWLHDGMKEGRRSSREFDVSFYLSQYPDLQAAFGAQNYGAAVDHWITSGIREGRKSALEFDVSFYLRQYPDLQTAFGAQNYAAAIDHWLQFGINEGRKSSPKFDVGFYLMHYPDLQAAFGAQNYVAAFNHWLQFGMKEGRIGAITPATTEAILNIMMNSSPRLTAI